MILVTSGGIPADWSSLGDGVGGAGAWLVVPGGAATREHRGRLILLPHHSGYYHPDLVRAADAVVGKVGYSTLAEAWHAGIPFGYVTRKLFRETEVLGRFVDEKMEGVEIPEESLLNGSWMRSLPELLALPRVRREGPNGAGEIASAVIRHL